MCDPIIGAAAIGVGDSLLSTRSQNRAAAQGTQAGVQSQRELIQFLEGQNRRNEQINAPFVQDELDRRNIMRDFLGLAPMAPGLPSGGTANSMFMGSPGGGGYPGQRGEGNAFRGTRFGEAGRYASPGFAQSRTQSGAAAQPAGESMSFMERFNASPYGMIMEADTRRGIDATDNVLSRQGLSLSSARQNAASDVFQRNMGNNLNAFLGTVMGAPPTPATNATMAGNNATAGGVGNAMTNIGNIQMQGAYQRGANNAAGIQGIGNALQFGLGSWK